MSGWKDVVAWMSCMTFILSRWLATSAMLVYGGHVRWMIPTKCCHGPIWRIAIFYNVCWTFKSGPINTPNYNLKRFINQNQNMATPTINSPYSHLTHSLEYILKRPQWPRRAEWNAYPNDTKNKRIYRKSHITIANAITQTHKSQHKRKIRHPTKNTTTVNTTTLTQKPHASLNGKPNAKQHNRSGHQWLVKWINYYCWTNYHILLKYRMFLSLIQSLVIFQTLLLPS